MLRMCVGHPIFSALFAGFLHGFEYSSEIYLVFLSIHVISQSTWMRSAIK